MDNKSDLSKYNIEHDEISLKDIFSALRRGFRIISICISSAFLITIIYTTFASDIYRSVALVTPVNEQNSGESIFSEFDSVASLAGVNLSSNLGSLSIEAAARIETFTFFQDHVLPNIFLPNLVATKKWDRKTNTIIYDKSIYDAEEALWVRKVSFPKTPKPSAQEAFNIFIKLLSVSRDDDTGFIKFSVEHKSPYISQKWVEIIFNEINSSLRQKKKKEAENALLFLNKQISTTGFADVKQNISMLIQKEFQNLTLIEKTEDFVFQYIDYPVVEEKKYKPQTLILLIIASITGFLLGSIISLSRYLKVD